MQEWRSYLAFLQILANKKNQKRLLSQEAEEVFSDSKLKCGYKQTFEIENIKKRRKLTVNAFNCPYLTNDGDNYLHKMSYDTCDFYSLSYLSLYFNFARPKNSE